MEDRLETLEPVKLLVETINEFQIMAQEKNLSLELRGEDTHILIEGNPLQIRQVYSNLIGNAIKYTPAGGSVVISIQRLDQTLEVQIQDTGYGIPAADLPFIFDRFYRVRSGKASDIEGNGLGLAIVKSIVERHKGKIMVQSEMERGSTFCVSLPISESNSSIS